MTSDNKRSIAIAIGVLGLFWGIHQHDMRLRTTAQYGVSFIPFTETEQRYEELANCLEKKIEIPFKDLKWRVGDGPVPNFLGHDTSTDKLIGAFDYRTNTIYIREGQVDLQTLLLHEMTHAIVYPEGGHPNWAFNGKCGNVL